MFNQSMSHSGLHPVLPDTAVVIYPRRNRLAIFKGNLLHGVLGSDTPAIRTTLLVNFWRNKTAGDPSSPPVAIDKHIMRYVASLVNASRDTVTEKVNLLEIPIEKSFYEDISSWKKQKLPTDCKYAVDKSNNSKGKAFIFRLKPSTYPYNSDDLYQNWFLWPIDPVSERVVASILPKSNWRTKMPGGDPFTKFVADNSTEGVKQAFISC